ncbi:MAG: DUF2520 domain-containing protein [Thermoanaerobaculales bacterium]
MQHPRYGLVGRGRAATHMARYLRLEGLLLSRWHRGLETPLEEALAPAEVILLLISDDSLEQFVEARPALRGRLLVHFSGSLVVDGLAGLHPLMTFGPDPYSLETYRSMAFIEEKGGTRFREVFPTLPNPSWPVEPNLKPLYHALCVLSGNFTTLLWAKAFEEFRNRLGLPREVLMPYLEQTCRNVAARGREALTGALARGDRDTAARDLAALEGDPFAEVYRAFAQLVDNREGTS